MHSIQITMSKQFRLQSKRKRSNIFRKTQLCYHCRSALFVHSTQLCTDFLCIQLDLKEFKPKESHLKNCNIQFVKLSALCVRSDEFCRTLQIFFSETSNMPTETYKTSFYQSWIQLHSVDQYMALSRGSFFKFDPL